VLIRSKCYNQSLKLKPIAIAILKKAQIPQEEKYGSIIAILMVISIILTIIRVIQECNKEKISALSNANDRFSLYGTDIRNFSKKRGWFTKMKIRKIIRRELDRDQYKEHGEKLLYAILDEGENLTDDQVVTLVEAANV
jgi:hypothetical protein